MDPALQEDAQASPGARGDGPHRTAPSSTRSRWGGATTQKEAQEAAGEAVNLDVLVQNPAHSREGAVRPLLPDNPALGGCQLSWINKDEAARLSKGLQDKGCEPETGSGGDRGLQKKSAAMCPQRDHGTFPALPQASASSSGRWEGPICPHRAVEST